MNVLFYGESNPKEGKCLKLINPLGGMPHYAEILEDTHKYLLDNKKAYIKSDNIHFSEGENEMLINITIAVPCQETKANT